MIERKGMAKQASVAIKDMEAQEDRREWYYCNRYDIMVCREVCESRRQDSTHWRKCNKCPLFMPPEKRRDGDARPKTRQKRRCLVRGDG